LIGFHKKKDEIEEVSHTELELMCATILISRPQWY